jgi:hypothetical protein
MVGLLEREKEEKPPPLPDATEVPVVGPAGAIVCAHCGHHITSRHQRIGVLGTHEHRFMNPGGFLFHIGCFAEAAGCAIIGTPSDDYPWFPGYSWRLALCGACADHLGWHFQSPEGAFYGLRLDRLREAGPPGE